ncbi:MAG: SURF1 family protein [Burkholderiales bacterium]|nr:MAG: SURF1 family protein [Burkholderiales bacterium]
MAGSTDSGSARPARRQQRWVVLLAAVVAVTITARLGVWQLDRAAQKERLQLIEDERRQLPALSGEQLAFDAAAADAQYQRAVHLTGRWAAGATVFLDNRPMNGRAGFLVVTPLVLADGSGVLVQRGWVARDAADPRRLPPLDTAAGAVAIIGRVAPPPSRLFELEPAAPGPIRQNLDVQAFAREVRLPLRPLSVMQVTDSGAAFDGLLREWPRPAADVHKHYGYAFQWFALAVLIAGLYVWFQLLRPRRDA